MRQLVLGNFLAETRRMVATQTLRAVVGTEHDLHEHQGKGILRSP